MQHGAHEVPPDLRFVESHGYDQPQLIDNKRLRERQGLGICVGNYTSCRAGRATPGAERHDKSTAAAHRPSHGWHRRANHQSEIGGDFAL